jgi:hypothetical protein
MEPLISRVVGGIFIEGEFEREDVPIVASADSWDPSRMSCRESPCTANTGWSSTIPCI